MESGFFVGRNATRFLLFHASIQQMSTDGDATGGQSLGQSQCGQRLCQRSILQQYEHARLHQQSNPRCFLTTSPSSTHSSALTFHSSSTAVITTFKPNQRSTSHQRSRRPTTRQPRLYSSQRSHASWISLCHSLEMTIDMNHQSHSFSFPVPNALPHSTRFAGRPGQRQAEKLKLNVVLLASTVEGQHGQWGLPQFGATLLFTPQ